MRGGLSKTLALVGAAGLLAVSACGNSDNSGSGGGNSSANKDVEVFTWWADGGEKAGLDGLVSVFKHRLQRTSSSSTARSPAAPARTPSRCWPPACSQSNPPDTFQAHAGAELTDYINAGQVEDLSSVYKDWGLDKAFPQGPHRQPDRRRQDLLGAGQHPPRQRGVGQQDGAGRRPASPRDARPPGRVLRRPGQAQGRRASRAAGLGKDWTQVMLFEAVLIADLGADKFTGLWNGKTDWAGADVTKAIAERLQEAAHLHQQRPRHVRLDRRARSS